MNYLFTIECVKRKLSSV